MDWINIKDRQPDEGQKILCAELPKTDSSILWASIGKASYDTEDGYWACWENNEYESKIDYWMPIEDLLATLPK